MLSIFKRNKVGKITWLSLKQILRETGAVVIFLLVFSLFTVCLSAGLQKVFYQLLSK